jgi:hypothetical protein
MNLINMGEETPIHALGGTGDLIYYQEWHLFACIFPNGVIYLSRLSLSHTSTGKCSPLHNRKMLSRLFSLDCLHWHGFFIVIWDNFLVWITVFVPDQHKAIQNRLFYLICGKCFKR